MTGCCRAAACRPWSAWSSSPAASICAQGVLDLIRGRILGRIGTALDEALNDRVFDTIVRLPLLVGSRNDGLQPLRDLDNVRSFLGGMGPSAFFDLPWLPLYLAICFAFHCHDRRHGAGRRGHPGRR